MTQSIPHIPISLEPIPLEREDLDFLRDLALAENIQYFNVRFVKGISTQISLLQKISKASNLGIGKGFSIQAFCKEGGYGFAIGHDFSAQSIQETFLQAAGLAKWSSKFSQDPFSFRETSSLPYAHEINPKFPFHSIDPETKVQNLLEIEQEAYFDSRIRSTSLNYSDYEVQRVSFNNSGRFGRVKESGLFFILQAIAKNEFRQEGYHVSHGGIGGYEILDHARGFGTKAATQAIELLDSKASPSGVHNMIIDPFLTGTFIHEAFGHAVEADSVLAGESILADQMGTIIGNPLVTIVDDPTLSQEFGYYKYDSEGVEAKKTTIVRQGRLESFLHSLETASKMDVEPTGNARASSYSVTPQVRMSNTYLAPGDSELEEMITEMKNGILGIGWKYGYTDPIEGTFQFKLAKAYLIENGEKTQILRDTAISGLTLDVLNRIKLIGNTVKQDPGYCGKGGQSVPVGSGGPHVLITDMVVGGQ